MTGGLPAFVEIGENFDSAHVKEESLIEQWSEGGKRVILAGDDTWLKLFPDYFSEAYPFESFNTRDLDTVDEGIMSILKPILNSSVRSNEFSDDSKGKENVFCDKNEEGPDSCTISGAGKDWDVFIAHFLGVDHIGHTYHAHHPFMKERLSAMDSLLMEVIEYLKKDAERTEDGGENLLILFGDHGMTDAGEHGKV